MKYEWLNEFLLSQKCAEKDFKAEWQWTRYLIKGKMFAAICKAGDGVTDIITLKADPEEGEFLRQQYKEIVPGHYMNKFHWNSIDLNGEVPDDLIKDLVEKSYSLVIKELTKKVQQEIVEATPI